MRALTFEQAKARYPHRYTMEHVPAWARRQCNNGKYYAPQYATDAEWYEKTKFPGESPLCFRGDCYSGDQSWPLGQWLEQPYKRERA